MKHYYRRLIARLAEPVVRDLLTECNRFEAENSILVAESVRISGAYTELERMADWQRRELDVQQMTIGTLRDEVREATRRLASTRPRLELVPAYGSRRLDLGDIAQEKRYSDGQGD